MFGDAIEYARVSVRRRKWFPFQPRKITMAPMGHLHFHPLGDSYCDDFSLADIHRQGHFIHELTHVWQAHARGRWFLILNRMPWARYDYSLRPGWSLARYGIEQQAEIVRHAFLLRNGVQLTGIADVSAYDPLVDFPGTADKT